MLNLVMRKGRNIWRLIVKDFFFFELVYFFFVILVLKLLFLCFFNKGNNWLEFVGGWYILLFKMWDWELILMWLFFLNVFCLFLVIFGLLFKFFFFVYVFVICFLLLLLLFKFLILWEIIVILGIILEILFLRMLFCFRDEVFICFFSDDFFLVIFKLILIFSRVFSGRVVIRVWMLVKVIRWN